MPSSTVLAQLSDNLIYSAIVVYALTLVAYAAEAALPSVSRRSPVTVAATGPTHDAQESLSGGAPDPNPSRVGRVGRVAVSLTILAWILHAVGVLTRGLAAGRAPWGNMYEFALVGALAAAGAYLVLLRREALRALGVWVVGVVLLSLGLAVTVLYTPAGSLVPALNSYWLVIHVAAAILAGGVFTVGAGTSLLYVLRLHVDRHRNDAEDLGGAPPWLPPAAALDRVTHAAHVFAFPVWTFAVIAGAIWAENAWGRYWGWDPKETWAFITWVLYAAYLHAHATAGWRRKATWFAVAGYLAFVFNFFGINLWITGLHSYAGV